MSVSIAVLAMGTPLCAQTSMDDGDGSEEAEILTQSWHGGIYEWILPEFVDISVHDPSLVLADGNYYVFGSHLSAAKTEDLMTWDRVADLVSTINPLFDNVFQELEETFEWAQTNTLWAADVIQLEDGKFYFYYNACQGSSPRSAMGVAVSDAVEGPYEDLGIILRSGMWNQISEDGETIYDAVVHPNVVDPDTFFDEAGKLWMIYGSYSGGLFILEMDRETGLPIEGQGYGKHLMGGNHQRIEGPNVRYSPHTGYYYMFVTFGGLAANGGYNMRVARSETPEGPYFDSEGNDMRDVIGPTAFNDTAIAPYAAKLMGNHLYRDTDQSLGYVSPGHNTTHYNPETGQYFLIFHTRFPYKGEFHQVRVHEMFFNEEGWPVVAPLRFAPRTDLLTLPAEEAEAEGTEHEAGSETDPVDDGESADGEQSEEASQEEESEEETPVTFVWYADPISIDDIPGEYQFINHGKDTTSSIKMSQGFYLHADGTLSTGSLEGTWSFHPEAEWIPSAEDEAVAEDEVVDDLETDGSGAAEGTPGDSESETNKDQASEQDEPEAILVPVNWITLEIETLGTYKGAVSLQWNEYLEKFTVTFTAQSEVGESVWGARWSDISSSAGD